MPNEPLNGMYQQLKNHKETTNSIFKNYYRIIYFSFGVILLITFILAYFQYQYYTEQEKQRITQFMERNTIRFNYLIEKINGYLDQMQAFAQNYLQNQDTQFTHPLFEELKYEKKQFFFHLDSLPTRFPISTHSNVTGLRNPFQYGEKAKANLQMSLFLSSFFQKTIQKISNAKLVYYYGNKEELFVNIFPHVPSTVFRVQPHYWQLHYDVYQAVFPQNNPKRELTWTKIYIDEAGNGLMVSTMLPVYKKDEFYGFFGLDLTLDSLNNSIIRTQLNQGELFIINQAQQVLAHPTLVSSQDTAIKTLEQIIPAFSKSEIKKIFSRKLRDDLVYEETKDYFVYQQAIQHTDWRLVYMLNKKDLYQEVFYQIGLWLTFMFLLVLLILLVTAFFTQRYFIKPAEQLIWHIQNEQAHNPTTLAYYPPKGWKTWFEVVSFIFQQNRETLQMQQNLNIQLEDLVKERTNEIQSKNEEISARNEELLQQYEELEQQREELNKKNIIIERQNTSLMQAKEDLERKVEERTLQLFETNQSLIDQNNQLEQYAFISAHNLRAPVARIIGLVNILDRENILNPDNQMILDKLEIASNELDMVIKDLNIIVDIKKRTQEKIEAIDLGSILNEVLENLEKEIQTNQAIIEADFDQVNEVNFVRPYLRSIFYNLISNAIKYKALDRNPHIRIHTTKTEKGVLLQFEDNGLGFDLSKYENKVFQIYQRFHSHVGGKGIGLYLVRIQVESIGGTIELESTLHKGSTFKIFIPHNQPLD